MNIFTNIESSASIYILLWLFGAFLIGLIVGWYIWGVAKRALEAEMAELKAELNTLSEDHKALKVELETSKTTYAELKANYDWKARRLHDIETEKGDLHTQIHDLKGELKEAENRKLALTNEIEGLNASYNGAKSNIDTLELKINGLEAEIKEAGRIHNNLNREIKGLENQLEATKLSYSSTNDVSAIMDSDLETASETIADLNAKIAGLESNITEYKSLVVSLQSSDDDLKAAHARTAALEGKIAGLSEELDHTQAALAACRDAKAELHAAAITVSTEVEEMTIDDAKVAIANALSTTIGTATADQKDDLTEIKGIGEFVEHKLNDLGIYTFRQIAQFDDHMIAYVTRAIEFFPGRIERDEWIPQAAVFVGGSPQIISEDDTIEVEGAPVSKVSPEDARREVKAILSSQFPNVSADDKEDLKIIGGIGPFIEEKLNNLGIYTYEQISSFDEKMINLVTDAIEFFPGRIERDQWVKQAKSLFDAKYNG